MDGSRAHGKHRVGVHIARRKERCGHFTAVHPVLIAACHSCSPAFWCFGKFFLPRPPVPPLLKFLGKVGVRGRENPFFKKGFPPQPDDKPRFAVFAPPTAAMPPGGKARKSVAYGAAKPRPAPDFRGCPPLSVASIRVKLGFIKAQASWPQIPVVFRPCRIQGSRHARRHQHAPTGLLKTSLSK